MNRKIWAIIIIVIIIICISVYMLTSNSVEHVQINGTDFSVPSNYNIQKQSENLVKCSLDGNFFCINSDVNGSNISDVVSSYTKFRNETLNTPIHVSHITDNGLDYFKAVVENDTRVVHYWFTIEGKIYEIYTATGDSNTDKLIQEVIKSGHMIK